MTLLLAPQTAGRPDLVQYVTDNLRDAEALGMQLECPVYIRLRRIRNAITGNTAVNREFIVLPDARGWPESDFSGDRVPR